MSKRLIKTERGRGLYEISDEFGAGRLVWEQLPKLDAADPAARLAAESATKIPDLPGGLYGNDEQRRANERRRAADAVLEQAGLRPPRGWLRAARRGRPGRIGLCVFTIVIPSAAPQTLYPCGNHPRFFLWVRAHYPLVFAFLPGRRPIFRDSCRWP
jgi:hypothetical protein